MNATNFQTGYTIGGGHGEERKARLKREQADKKNQRRKTAFLILGVVGTVLTLLVIAKGFNSLQEILTTQEAQRKVKSVQPTVDIINEQSTEKVSSRVKTFVARLEESFIDAGAKVDHVILPAGKAREVDVFLKNREERYRMNLDRGAAVQVEDALRMQKYVDEHGVKVEYVDVRVDGRGFYK